MTPASKPPQGDTSASTTSIFLGAEVRGRTWLEQRQNILVALERAARLIAAAPARTDRLDDADGLRIRIFTSSDPSTDGSGSA